MEHLWNDLRYAWRNLRRSPGFAAVAVLTLALGMGANAAIFTVAKRVLMDPLAYPESGRLMAIMESNLELGYPRFSLSPPNYVDFRDQNRSFESVAAVTGGSFSLTGEGLQAERLSGLRVSGGYFQVYGTRPALGREIDDGDDRPGAEKVVVLNHGLWQRRFGGERGVLGGSLELNGESHAVIGVMPPRFHEDRDVFVPLGLDYGREGRGGHYLAMRGRLAPGVSVDQADAEMKQIAARLAQEYPDTNTGWSASVVPLKDLVVEDHRGIILLLLAAVGLVLLVACANVANLLLVRMAIREREVAVRAALGASRGRLVGQLLTEAALLALVGGGLGTLLAWRGTGALVEMNAEHIPRADEITVDGGVLLFVLALSLATGLLFGFLPALQASRPDLHGTLKEGGRGQAGGARGQLVRGLLVMFEVTAAVILLVGAGLLLRSLVRLVNVDPGFEPAGALTARLDLPEAKYPEDADQARFYRRLFDRLAVLPGVEAAGGVMPMPLTGAGFILTFWVEGTPIPEPNKSPYSNIRVVNEGYFEAMKIPLRRGRIFARADDLDAPWVAVINESTAARYFPGRDPLGRRITFDDPGNEEIRWMEIVGVVGDVHHEDLAAATDPEIYWSYVQRPYDTATLVLRAAADPGTLTGPLRAAVAELDPDIPIYGVRTLERIVADSVARPRFNGLLWALFAGLALLLAVIGVYGVLSYSVTRRQREIGVRLALGSERSRVLALVLRGGMALVGAGLAAGLVAAFVAARLLASMVYEVSPADPVTFAGVALVLAAVGAAACLVPALRATRVDPAVVLREE